MTITIDDQYVAEAIKQSGGVDITPEQIHWDLLQLYLSNLNDDVDYIVEGMKA